VTAIEFEGGMASDSLTLARWFRGLCAAEVVSGMIDRRSEYGSDSRALGHTGSFNGFTTVALCFPDPGIVVVVLANADHDVDTVAGSLVQTARP
jgi:hypothetical protein